MLAVPLGVIGALLAATFRGLTNDVYFQVGLLANYWFVGEERDIIVDRQRLTDSSAV